MGPKTASFLLTVVLVAIVFHNTNVVRGLESVIRGHTPIISLDGALEEDMIRTSWKSAKGTQTIETKIADHDNYAAAELVHDDRVAKRQDKHPIIN